MKKKYPVSRLKEFFVAYTQCQLVCGDGSGKRPERHVENCPLIKMENESDNLSFMNKKELREKIAERLDFLSDHWATDDKRPFLFGEWREEVLDEIIELIDEYVAGIIGEDEFNTATNGSKREAEILYSNYVRAEQRKKAEL